MRGALAAATVALVTALMLSAPGGASAAELPPELSSLEQRMAQLQANSERFTFEEELSVGEIRGASIPFDLLIDGRGEASDAPAEASLEAGILSHAFVRTRTIGETEWTYDQRAQELDHGHPWLAHQRKPKEATPEALLDPGEVLENDRTGGQATFSKLVEELNEAQSVIDVGPVTVDDQRVIEFDASLNPLPLIAKLEAQVRAKSKNAKKPLESLFPELSSGESKRSHRTYPPPTLGLEVFIAPEGLPVRIRATFTDSDVTVALRVDTVAINVPVSIEPPPASQTISEHKLKQLERRRARRQAERDLRVCRHVPAKFVERCRASARREAGGGEREVDFAVPGEHLLQLLPAAPRG